MQFKPLLRTEYDRILEQVDAGDYVPKTRPFSFDLQDYQADPEGYKKTMMEVLYVD